MGRLVEKFLLTDSVVTYKRPAVIDTTEVIEKRSHLTHPLKHSELSFSMNVVSLKFTKGFQKRVTAALKHTQGVILYGTHFTKLNCDVETEARSDLQQQGRMQSWSPESHCYREAFV